MYEFLSEIAFLKRTSKAAVIHTLLSLHVRVTLFAVLSLLQNILAGHSLKKYVL